MRDGRPMMASEINEMQSIGLARHKALASSLYKDGDIVAGAQMLSMPKPALCSGNGRQDLSGRADLGPVRRPL